MNNPEEHKHEFCHGHHGRRGPSSFWMHDPAFIFSEIGLKNGDYFLDIGCGPGDYALYAAGIVGESGAIYAVDRWEEMVIDLINTADVQGLNNLIGIISDITAPLPLENHSIDTCLISTVLHTLALDDCMKSLLDEIHRVLKPDGSMTIIECKKQQASFGPPLHLRISPEEIETYTAQCSFEKTCLADLGHNYLIKFKSLNKYE
jgi:ubiquinone/menaquinone biosynthesis C-methylase UbiE